jgi:rRNA maturation RNase YbeY
MIGFHNEDVSFRLREKRKIKTWISAQILRHKRTPGDIQFIFCSDEHLLRINRQFLDHDTYTDIITFDYSEGNKDLPVSGDIFISIDRVRQNALKFKTDPETELKRVLIHGVLHLLGFKDKNKPDKAAMTAEEDKAIRAWPKT